MYLGNIPATSFETVQKDRFTGVTGTTVTLSHAVSSVNDILCFVNSVKQDYTNYSVNLTTLTLGGTLVASDIVEVCYVGRTFQTVNPSVGSVGTSQLANLGITNGKIANSTIEVGKVASSLKNTPAFEATKSATQSFANNTTVKITFDGTNFDTDSAFNTTDSTFVVPSGKAGKYYFAGQSECPGVDSGEIVQLQINKNGSIITKSLERKYAAATNQTQKVRTSIIVDLAVGDAIDFRLFQNSGGAQNIDQTETFFRGFKLIGD